MEKSGGRLKKHIKKYLLWFVILSVVGTTLLTILNSEERTTRYPEATKYFFIEDCSRVYTEETENFIMEQAVALQTATSAQVVVVSVPHTQEDTLETFSLNLANYWGIGDRTANNGVLILFTTDEPHVRLEVGRGLEGCLNDAKCGRILDTWAVDAKDNYRWNEAAINTFVAVAQVIYEEYGMTAPESLSAVDKVNEEAGGGTFADTAFPNSLLAKNTAPMYEQIITAFLLFWLFAGIPFLVVCIASYLKISNGDSGSSNRRGGFFYMGGGGGFGGSSGGGFGGGGGSFGGGGASR